MNKKILFIVALFAITAQVAPAQSSVSKFASEQEARHMISLIVNVVGLKPNFTIKAGDVNNAAAVIIRGERYILYNPVFIRQVKNAVQTDWGGISIIAHEVGHHLNGHTLLGSGSTPAVELEADEFSGFVLRRLGATLEESQAAMRLISSEHTSKTHPGRNSRLTSIHQGWQRADLQMEASTKPAVAKSKKSLPETSSRIATRYSFPKKYISYNLHLYALPSEKFYLTIQNNLVRVTDQGYQVIGSLVNDGRFYYLSFSSKEKLRVTSKGEVLDDQGSRIGQVYKEA